MENPWFIGAALLVILVSAESGSARQQPAPGDPVKGKATYMRVGCYECHGIVAQGGVAPRLAPNPRTTESLTAFVRKPVTMPPYSAKVLPDADVADIRAYLASLPPPRPVSSIPLLNQ